MECKKFHLCSFHEDCDCRHSDDVITRCEAALKLLASYDIFPGTPDPNNSVWEYGMYIKKHVHGPTSGVEKLSPRERLSIFAYHLNQIILKATSYPNRFFIGNNSKRPLILPDGSKIERDRNSSSTSSDNSDSSDSETDNFHHAMNTYNFLRLEGDIKADTYLQRALKMPDSPMDK